MTKQLLNPVTVAMPFIAALVITERGIEDYLESNPDIPAKIRTALEMRVYQLKAAWDAFQDAGEEFRKTVGSAMPTLREAEELVEKARAKNEEEKQAAA